MEWWEAEVDIWKLDRCVDSWSGPVVLEPERKL